MLHHVELWISHYGTAAVFVIFFTEMLGAPFPAETTLTLLGVEISRGVLHFWPVWWLASIGNIGGSTVSYWVGARFGAPSIARILRKFPRASQKWTETSGRMNKSEQATVVFGKFISIARVLVPFLAGVNRMPLLRFTILNSTSAFVWSALYLLEGRYIAILGNDTWHAKRVLFIVPLVLIALIFVRWVLRQLRRSA